jgi:hypothetical protein
MVVVVAVVLMAVVVTAVATVAVISERARKQAAARQKIATTHWCKRHHCSYSHHHCRCCRCVGGAGRESARLSVAVDRVPVPRATLTSAVRRLLGMAIYDDDRAYSYMGDAGGALNRVSNRGYIASTGAPKHRSRRWRFAAAVILECSTT